MNRSLKSNKVAPLFLALLLPLAVLATGCQKTDAALTAEIKSKMAADSTVPATRIDVDTQDHVVTLTGNVETPAQKERAIEIARATQGVVNVVDMLSVERAGGGGDAPDADRSLGDRIDDAAITMAVKTKLLDDPAIEGMKIDVDTRQGIVYLTGTVKSSAAKSRAVELARNVENVRDVQADLEVRG